MLAVALDLANIVTVTRREGPLEVHVSGEGAGRFRRSGVLSMTRSGSGGFIADRPDNAGQISRKALMLFAVSRLKSSSLAVKISLPKNLVYCRLLYLIMKWIKINLTKIFMMYY